MEVDLLAAQQGALKPPILAWRLACSRIALLLASGRDIGFRTSAEHDPGTLKADSYKGAAASLAQLWRGEVGVLRSGLAATPGLTLLLVGCPLTGSSRLVPVPSWGASAPGLLGQPCAPLPRSQLG